MAGRGLTAGEVALAQEVFGEAISLPRVRLHRGGFGRFAVTLGDCIFLPPDLVHRDFAQAELGAQALLIHELVHVWQFQTRPLRTLVSWAKTVLQGGYGPGLPGYRYAWPLGRFDRLGLERQASVVEHAFMLKRGCRVGAMPGAVTQAALIGATPFPVTA